MTNLLALRRFRQFGRADEGQALVLGALALVVLMLMGGLGVEVGFLRYQKLQMQKAADAGAIAGASALLRTRYPDAREALFHQQLQQQLRILTIGLLLPHSCGFNLGRISNPQLETQFGQ